MVSYESIEAFFGSIRERYEKSNLYVGVDPAVDPSLRFVAEGIAQDARCLYTGEALEEYGDSAPWIFQDDDSASLCHYLLQEQLGKRAFVIFLSSAPFDEFHVNIRRFTKIRTTDGQILIWKLFNPDALGTFLPFLTLEQRAHFFSGLTGLMMEVSDGQRQGLGLMRLRDDGILLTETVLPAREPGGDLEYAEGEISDVNATMPEHLRIDVEGVATRPLMTFTVAQLEAPVLFNRPKLIAEVREHVLEEFSEALADVPPKLLVQYINHGINLAIQYHLNDVTSIKTFVDLMMRIAPGWHRQKDINKVLLRKDLPPDEKLRVVTSERYDRAWSEAATYDSADEWLSPELLGEA